MQAFRSGQLRFFGLLSKHADGQAFERLLDRSVRTDWVVYTKPLFGEATIPAPETCSAKAHRIKHSALCNVLPERESAWLNRHVMARPFFRNSSTLVIGLAKRDMPASGRSLDLAIVKGRFQVERRCRHPSSAATREGRKRGGEASSRRVATDAVAPRICWG